MKSRSRLGSRKSMFFFVFLLGHRKRKRKMDTSSTVLPSLWMRRKSLPCQKNLHWSSQFWRKTCGASDIGSHHTARILRRPWAPAVRGLGAMPLVRLWIGCFLACILESGLFPTSIQPERLAWGEPSCKQTMRHPAMWFQSAKRAGSFPWCRRSLWRLSNPGKFANSCRRLESLAARSWFLRRSSSRKNELAARVLESTAFLKHPLQIFPSPGWGICQSDEHLEDTEKGKCRSRSQGREFFVQWCAIAETDCQGRGIFAGHPRKNRTGLQW